MADPIITTDDLAPFASIDAARAQAMIDDALAMATKVAPCLADETFPHAAAAKAILRRAILRWNETGASGGTTQQSAGPFSQSVTPTASKGLFWPSEISELQSLCKDVRGGGAFTIRPAGVTTGVHSQMCSLLHGGTWCTCGSDINRYEGPIFNGGW